MSKVDVFKTIGATNHRADGKMTLSERREICDFYATDPVAIDRLEVKFSIPQFVWECACGAGHLSERLRDHGHEVVSTDLIGRGYGTGGVDFLSKDVLFIGDDAGRSVLECIVGEMKVRRERGEEVAILTNPPFLTCTDFVLRGLEFLPHGGYLIYLMRTLCLEGIERFERIYRHYRPRYVFQMTSRLLCAKNGDFYDQEGRLQRGAQAYAWYVWRKGDYGSTVTDWI